MWALWRKKGKEGNGESKADLALADANRNLLEAKKRGVEVTKVTNALRNERERNGFAEALEEMILGNRGPINDTRR